MSVARSDTQGYSSVGRVLVSKTMGRGFKSFCPCQNEKDHQKVIFFVLTGFCIEGLERSVVNDSLNGCQSRADRDA